MYKKGNPAGGGTPDGAKGIGTTVANHNQDEKQNQLTFDIEQARRFLRLLEPDPAAHDVGGDHAA
jgi:hypothetical protein